MFNIRIDPDMPPDQVRIEQDGKVLATIVNLQVETPSIAALKANLFYFESLRQKAFEQHKDAIIKANDAMTALNQAIVRKNSNA